MQKDLNELANECHDEYYDECCEAIKNLNGLADECRKAIKVILLKKTIIQCKYNENSIMSQLTHFIEERCIENANGQIRAGILYDAYMLWCEQQGCREISGTKFGLEIKKRFDSHRSNGVYYLGIELKKN